MARRIKRLAGSEQLATEPRYEHGLRRARCAVQDQHGNAIGLAKRGVVNAQFGDDIPGMKTEVANHRHIMLRLRLRVSPSH